ncbi:MAG: alpha/beta hydrolase family protein [Paracoccaceae bacterium]
MRGLAAALGFLGALASGLAAADDRIGWFETEAFPGTLKARASDHEGAPAAAPLGFDEIESLRTQLPVTIPTAPPDGGPHALDALVYAPRQTPAGLRRPVIVITHGNPRDTRQQRATRLHRYGHLAEEFARRGYVAAVVARRGFARSSGHYVGWYGRCDSVEADGYERAGRTGAQDLRAALSALAEDPRIDPARMMALGTSGGGFAALALAAEMTELRGAIAFAPGRGSVRDGENCNADALAEAFARFGRPGAAPSLWLYSTEDRFFGPEMVHRQFAAFGGPARLVMTGAILHAKDGHRLFQRGNTALWRGEIDAFLRAIGMPTWEAPPADPTDLDMPPPDGLSPRGLAAWREYLGSEASRAFATGQNGRFGWASAYRSGRIAEREALETCQEGTQAAMAETETPCEIRRTDTAHR